MTWHSIKSAPKDGRIIMARVSEGQGDFECFFRDGEWWAINYYIKAADGYGPGTPQTRKVKPTEWVKQEPSP